VLACSVGEFGVVGLAMLPCCPETDVANINAATKQITTRLTIIGAPHDSEVGPISPGPSPFDQASSACLYNSADGGPMFSRGTIDKMCRRGMSSNVVSERANISPQSSLVG